MSSSGFEATHVRGQDAFADLSVEATLIDPKYALPADLRALADKLASDLDEPRSRNSEECSPAPKPRLAPRTPTRVKVRVNDLGSGQSTQIGEMIPANMDVLMTAHMPSSFTLDDIAGDELDAERALVKPVQDFSDEDEPKTVNAFIEHSLPEMPARVTRHKQPALHKPTSAMRPSREKPVEKQPVYDQIETIDPDPTMPPASKSRALPQNFPQNFPQNEVTKTSFGAIPRAPEQTDLEEAFHDDVEQKIVFRDDIDDDLADHRAFGNIEPDPLDEADVGAHGDAGNADAGSFGDVPGYHADSEFAAPIAERRSFDQILDRVRKPDVGPQRYIQTKITSNPKIGIMPEDTAIVKNSREEDSDSASGFADGKRTRMGSMEADALTKPPRMVSPYIIVGLGVIGAVAALLHAIQAPL